MLVLVCTSSFSLSNAQLRERHEIRCAISISPSEPYQSGSVTISFTLENIGNTTFNGKAALTVTPEGTSLASYSEIQLANFTGGSVQKNTQSFLLFFEGMYSARLTITPEKLDLLTTINLYVGSSLLESNTYSKQFYVKTLDAYIQQRNADIQLWIAVFALATAVATSISAFAAVKYRNKNKIRENANGNESRNMSEGKPEIKEEDIVLGLIRFVDNHKRHLFMYYDVYRGKVSLTLIGFIGILFLTEVVVIGDRYILGTMNDVDIVVIALSAIAVFTAFLSLMAQIGERNMVDVRFERALKLRQFTADEKPLLYSLVRLRSRNPKADLQQIYNMHPKMFTKERLLEKMYDETIFG